MDSLPRPLAQCEGLGEVGVGHEPPGIDPEDGRQNAVTLPRQSAAVSRSQIGVPYRASAAPRAAVITRRVASPAIRTRRAPESIGVPPPPAG